MRYTFKIDNKSEVTQDLKELMAADLVSMNTHLVHLLSDQKGYQVELVQMDFEEKILKLKHNGHVYSVEVMDAVDQMVSKMGLDKVNAKKAGDITAPMPGKVLEISVEPGQQVEENTPLIILEAMKMENVLKAPAAGEVESIEVQSGTTVNKGDLLIKIK